jgi:hypothetical protein
MLAHRTQPEVISNEELQRFAQEKPVAVKSKLWKWKWKRHTLRRCSSATDKKALSWNPSQCRRGRLRAHAMRMIKGERWERLGVRSRQQLQRFLALLCGSPTLQSEVNRK